MNIFEQLIQIDLFCNTQHTHSTHGHARGHDRKKFDLTFRTKSAKNSITRLQVPELKKMINIRETRFILEMDVFHTEIEHDMIGGSDEVFGQLEIESGASV